jgi:hypothetical protein
MRGMMMAAVLLAAVPVAVPVPLQARDAIQATPSGAAPASTSAAVPDLATYGRRLQGVEDNLRRAAGRPDVQTATEGRKEERGARQDLLRAMQEALAVVRSAPTEYRDKDEYKDAERRVRAVTQRVQGQHEPSDLNSPAQEIIQAVEMLRAKVVATDGGPAASEHG